MDFGSLSPFKFSLSLHRSFFAPTFKSFVGKSAVCIFIAGNSVGVIRVGEYFNNFMPRWRSSVDIDDPFNPNGYVLNDWGKFLVDSHSPFNQMWWQWSYDRLHSDPMISGGLSTPFAKVTKAFSPQWVWHEDHFIVSEDYDGELSLNNTCYNLASYRTYQLYGDILRDFWTFCSAGGGEIAYMKLLKNEISSEHPLKDEIHSFVDMNSSSNDWFWQIRQAEFESGVLPFIQFFYWNPKRNVRDMCRDIYEYKDNMKTAIASLASDKYGVLRFCGLATVPGGLERTAESYVYEELLYGYRNSRAF